MDKFFNNQKISNFLSHYSIDHWPDIIESFTLYSIRVLFLQYPEGTHLPTKELIEFFNKKGEDVSEELVSVYMDLHKLDKRIRQMVKHKLPNPSRSHSKHHSKSKKQIKTRDQPDVYFDIDKNNKIHSHYKSKDQQVSSDYQKSSKSRPQTEMKEYKCKENVSNDTHSPTARRISRNCNALHENEYNLVKPATTTSSTRNKNLLSKNKSKQTLSRRESIHSSNEKYELWVPEKNNVEKLVSGHRMDPYERHNSEITTREPIKVFNKFSSLIKDHKLKHNPERANSPLVFKAS